MPATGCRTASCGAPTTAGVESAARTSHLIREPVSAKKLARHVRNVAFSLIVRMQGELCLVFDDRKPSRANFFSLTPTSLRAGRTFSRRRIETAEHGAFSLTLGMTTSLD